ncbi:MAG: PKD domain-containing protein, partial [Thermoanaerobaculia bacterium]
MTKTCSSAPRTDTLFPRTALVLLPVLFLLLACPLAVQAQTFSDLGHALYSRGYTGTVWVNSFDPHQSRLAHGLFYPDIPIGPTGYDLRYGMELTGSGTVSVGTDGFYMATGTATNPNAISSDGSISIDLLSNGNVIDGVKMTFTCGASATCPWTAHFLTSPPVANPTVRVYRHVEGSNCGGELSIDLNGVCHDSLVNYLHLPATYHFTDTDNLDTNYVAAPGASTSVLCSVINPVCAGGSPTNPPPPPTPASNFNWSPSDIYPGTQVTFTDTSTSSPTGWSWSFQGGSPSSSSVANPSASFASPGTKTVTLTASNTAGAGSVALKNVVVLDPNPAGTLGVSVPTATQCQDVTFTSNVTGLPPLTYTWQVSDPNGAVLNPPGLVSGGTSFTWSSPVGVSPGNYTGKLTVQNSSNPTGLVLTKQVQITALPALADISTSAPTTNAFVANTVQFTAPDVTGATKVVWTYGDGKTDIFTDPVAGKTPSHTYTAIGTYSAKVTISNCINTTGSTSQPVSVNVTQTTPLIAAFQASLFCQLGQCFTAAGTAVGFNDTSQGADFWDYDWSHTGTDPRTCNFTDSGHSAPVPSHTYATAGTFQPCLQVRRGSSEQNVAVHSFAIVVSQSGPPPAITVSGPVTGQPNQAYSFTAFASNCTASSTGWSWSVSGGTIAGGSTGSSISVSWATTGTKTVSATNTGCSGAQGSQGISISSGGTTGTFQAQFNFTPASPKAGDIVAFDSSPSTGIPAGAGISWSFGDGGSASGATATHVYASAGSYNVQLSISQPGCLNPSCSSTVAKTVTVAPAGGGSTGGAHFTVSPASPSATQAATLDASSSTNVAAGSLFGWDFGDGSAPGFGTIILHAFPGAGTYNVVLAITPPGCTAASCLALASQSVIVGPPPPVTADYTTAACTNQFGIEQCQAQATTPVSLTATAADATTYAWDFGDGTNGAGRQVTHAWAQAGTYAVSLTAVKGSAAATKTRNFVITAPPAPQTKTTLLPLATQSRGVLVQSNDLYVYNPGSSPLDIAVEFRKRGTPDVNPPRVTTTLQPGATLYAPDMLSGLFNLENVAGFITVVTGIDKAEPVVTSFNSQGATASKQFGLTIPGSSVDSLGSASSSGPAGTSQFLVGLHDSPDRQSSFGFSNPTDETATYHLRFFDKTGRLL